LTACGGGGGGGHTTVPGTGTTLAAKPGATSAPRSSTAANVTVSFQIPAVPSASATLQALKRKPAFVSSGTDGVVLSAYLHSDTAHANPIASAVDNVSPGSSTCTGTTTRTCALTIGITPPAAGASIDFVVTLYAAAPVNGAIPATTAVLGTGTLAAQTVVANTQNAFTLTVLGVPAAASVTFAPPGTATLGQAATLPLIVTVFDASGATIEGTYATPLTLTTSDTTGATSFTVDSKPGSTIAASTDTPDLVYTGAALSNAAIGLTGTGLASGTVTTLTFVPGANPPVATASTISISQTGTTSATDTIRESGYTGSFTPSGCSGIANVTAQAASGGSQTFTIAAGASTGTCQLTFTDAYAQTVVVAVTVSGALMSSPSTLSFVSGSTTPKTFTATESGYTGTLTATSTCTSIATVSPPNTTGSPATFSVTPVASGTCQVTIHDTLGNSSIVAVSIAQPLTVTTSSVVLPTNGTISSTFTVAEAGYSGTFTVNGSSCTGVATVSPSAASGPSATITVSRIGTDSGSCGFTINDTNLQTVSVTVIAPALPIFSATPSSLTMPTNGATTATFTISESGYTGSFTLVSNTCGTLVTSSASGSAGSTTYTLTRGTASSGTPCQFAFADAYGQTVTESVSVPSLSGVFFATSGTVVVPGPAIAQFSESGYTGTETYQLLGCTGATITPATSTGSPATVDVTTTTPQTCQIQVFDAYGQEGTGNLSFEPLAPTAGGTVTVPFLTPFNATASASETGYSGSWTESDTCSGIASVGSFTSGPNPSATVTRISTTLTDSYSRSITDTVSVPTPIQGAISVALDPTDGYLIVANEAGTLPASQAAFVFDTSTGALDLTKAPLPGIGGGSTNYVRYLGGELYLATDLGPVTPYSLPNFTALPSFGTFSGLYMGIGRDASGQIYIPDGNANNIKVYSTSGTLTTSISETYPVGLALDSSGNVYTIAHVSNVIATFGPTPSFTPGSTVTLTSPPGSPSDLFIDAASNLWVSFYGSNAVCKYALTGGASLLCITTPSAPGGVDVDSSENVYIPNGNEVDEYNASGTHVRTIK
jgi:hypothetical protein